MSISLALHNVQAMRAKVHGRNKSSWVDLYIKTDDGEQLITLSFWGEGSMALANAYALAINEAAAAELARKLAERVPLRIVAAE